MYNDINFENPASEVYVILDKDDRSKTYYGEIDLLTDNDALSSYKITYNRSNAIEVTFWENEDEKGESFSNYSIYNTSSDISSTDICNSDETLHDDEIGDRLIFKYYWGDKVSSISWVKD